MQLVCQDIVSIETQRERYAARGADELFSAPNVKHGEAQPS
jgi:hypothetical protein